MWSGSVAAVVFVLVLTDVLAGGMLARADPNIGGSFVGARYAITPATLLAVAGGTAAMGALVASATVALLVLRRYWGAIRVAGVMLAAEAVSELIKVLVGRARPDYALAATTSASFPSGHATAAAALAMLLAWFATRHLKGRVLVAASMGAAAAWALAMAVGRLVLGVHYLTDVIGGLSLGVGVASFALAASVWAEARWPLTRS